PWLRPPPTPTLFPYTTLFRSVWGDTDRCPYSVGESGSRTTIMTGFAVVEAVRDLKKQIAEQGLPKGDAVLIGSAAPSPTLQGKVDRKSTRLNSSHRTISYAVF